MNQLRIACMIMLNNSISYAGDILRSGLEIIIFKNHAHSDFSVSDH